MLSKGNYRIDTDKVLGTGSFGVVHPAIHKFGRRVAAKRIDTRDQDKASRIAEDFNRLLTLTHKNIARVFEVFNQKTETLWVLMELCEHGDLVNYLKPRVERREPISDQEKLKLMLDIGTGVEYLHSKNVVHRDIKPSNVLVTGVPAVAKLTDFDLSKFFDDPFSTSLMTTPAGTQAFKAPEFFQRNPEGQINYRRNVDIFAMGLTFLGMIQDNPFLFLRVETPNEPSELYVPAGLLMWERSTYGTKPLTVVKIEESSDAAWWGKMKKVFAKKQNTAAKAEDSSTNQSAAWTRVRKVIAKMTRFEPRDRMSAAEVVDNIRAIAESPAPSESTEESLPAAQEAARRSCSAWVMAGVRRVCAALWFALWWLVGWTRMTDQQEDKNQVCPPGVSLHWVVFGGSSAVM